MERCKGIKNEELNIFVVRSNDRTKKIFIDNNNNNITVWDYTGGIVVNLHTEVNECKTDDELTAKIEELKAKYFV